MTKQVKMSLYLLPTTLQTANYGKIQLTQNCSVLQFMFPLLPPHGGVLLPYKYESAEAFRIGDILFQTTLACPIDDCISY